MVTISINSSFSCKTLPYNFVIEAAHASIRQGNFPTITPKNLPHPSAPGSHSLVLSPWFSVLGSWFSVPGSWFLVLKAYPNNPAARTAITPQAKRLPFFG
jgi:hypothetical protein